MYDFDLFKRPRPYAFSAILLALVLSQFGHARADGQAWKKWFELGSNGDPVPAASTAGTPRLKTSAVSMQDLYQRPGTASGTPSNGGQALSVRGLVRPKSFAQISTDLTAPVEKIPFGFGKPFRKGDTLVVFKCDRYKARLAAAKAEAQSAEIALRAKSHLQKHNAAGQNEVDTAKANFDKATAEVLATKSWVDQCVIKAPFDGRVVEQQIQEHEVPKANNPLLKIIGSKDLEIELIVPSKWLVWLKQGASFRFKVEETGATLEATVEQLGASVDPVSQTIQITGKFLAPPPQILAGMTGAAQFSNR